MGSNIDNVRFAYIVDAIEKYGDDIDMLCSIFNISREEVLAYKNIIQLSSNDTYKKFFQYTIKSSTADSEENIEPKVTVRAKKTLHSKKEKNVSLILKIAKEYYNNGNALRASQLLKQAELSGVKIAINTLYNYISKNKELASYIRKNVTLNNQSVAEGSNIA